MTVINRRFYLLHFEAIKKKDINYPREFLKEKAQKTLREMCDNYDGVIDRAENITRNMITKKRISWEYSKIHGEKKNIVKVFHIGMPIYYGSITSIEETPDFISQNPNILPFKLPSDNTDTYYK